MQIYLSLGDTKLSKATQRLNEYIRRHIDARQRMNSLHEKSVLETKLFREAEIQRLARTFIDQTIDRIALLKAEGIVVNEQRLLNILDDLENEVIPDRNCAALQSNAWPYPTPNEVQQNRLTT